LICCVAIRPKNPPCSYEKKICGSFKFTLRYIDDVHNSTLGDFVDRISPIDLEIKNNTDGAMSVSYLDLHIEIDSEGQLIMKLYEKRDDFNFLIANLTSMCSNIPAAPVYGAHISRLSQSLWFTSRFPV